MQTTRFACRRNHDAFACLVVGICVPRGTSTRREHHSGDQGCPRSADHQSPPHPLPGAVEFAVVRRPGDTTRASGATLSPNSRLPIDMADSPDRNKAASGTGSMRRHADASLGLLGRMAESSSYVAFSAPSLVICITGFERPPRSFARRGTNPVRRGPEKRRAARPSARLGTPTWAHRAPRPARWRDPRPS